jgi:hypothetical protein
MSNFQRCIPATSTSLCSSTKTPAVRDIRRNPPRLIFGELDWHWRIETKVCPKITLLYLPAGARARRNFSNPIGQANGDIYVSDD